MWLLYFTVIGASGNTHSYIRTNDDELKLAEIRYKNILPLEKPLIVILEISKGW